MSANLGMILGFAPHQHPTHLHAERNETGERRKRETVIEARTERQKRKKENGKEGGRGGESKLDQQGLGVWTLFPRAAHHSPWGGLYLIFRDGDAMRTSLSIRVEVGCDETKGKSGRRGFHFGPNRTRCAEQSTVADALGAEFGSLCPGGASARERGKEKAHRCPFPSAAQRFKWPTTRIPRCPRMPNTAWTCSDDEDARPRTKQAVTTQYDNDHVRYHQFYSTG